MHQLVVTVIHLDIELIKPLRTGNFDAAAIIPALIFCQKMMDGGSFIHDLPFPFGKGTGLERNFKALRHQRIPCEFCCAYTGICEFILCDSSIQEFLAVHRFIPEHCAGQRMVAKRHPAIHLERKVTIRPFRIFTVHYKNNDIILFWRIRPICSNQRPFHCIVGDIGQKSIRVIRDRLWFRKQLIPLRTQIDKVSRKLQLMLCGIQIDCSCIRERHTVGIELIGSGP